MYLVNKQLRINSAIKALKPVDLIISNRASVGPPNVIDTYQIHKKRQEWENERKPELPAHKQATLDLMKELAR